MKVFEDDLTVPKFLAALGWDEQKIWIFLNPRERMPKPFRSAALLAQWDSILRWLLFVTTKLIVDLETIGGHLQESDIENLQMVSDALDKYLNTLNAVRKPSKLSTSDIQKIFSLDLSASQIAASYNVSRQTVQKIKAKKIHAAILPIAIFLQ